MPIHFIAPSVERSKIVAEARLKFPLNLGDCFAYSLAKQEACPLIAIDGDFKRCDIELVCP